MSTNFTYIQGYIYNGAPFSSLKVAKYTKTIKLNYK